jgi:hypothetical protein
MKARGYGSATQKSAKKRAGVVSRKAGFEGHWTWCLPEGVEEGEEGEEGEVVADDEGVEGVEGDAGRDRPTTSTSSGEEGGLWRAPAPWTSSTDSTPSGDEEGEGVEEGEVVGALHAREAGPLPAARADGSVWCRDFPAHQSAHRSVSADPTCLICTPKEDPS